MLSVVPFFFLKAADRCVLGIYYAMERNLLKSLLISGMIERLRLAHQCVFEKGNLKLVYHRDEGSLPGISLSVIRRIMGYEELL